jgi:hypothetical protein
VCNGIDDKSEHKPNYNRLRFCSIFQYLGSFVTELDYSIVYFAERFCGGADRCGARQAIGDIIGVLAVVAIPIVFAMV